MKFAVIAILLIFPVAYAKTPASNRQAIPGREFRIKINQAVSFDRGRLKIAFNGVPQDSRCPEGVNCVWSGNAEVALSLATADGRRARITLNTHLNPREFDFNGYRIKLISLTPAPRERQRLNPNRYRAVLTVTKN
jgi:hypothetical protein